LGRRFLAQVESILRIAPEERIHFAGEHASLAHAWIQGASESGLRAAGGVNHAAARAV
jgi:monoamine oxidase